MGSILMKKFFDKENFLFSSFDKKQKQQSLFVAIALMVFFVFAAFSFFNALYCFSDIVGCFVSGSPDVAAKDFLRSLPIFLSAFMSIWTILLLQASFRNIEERRLKSYKKNAIALLVFAGVTIVHVLVMRIIGKYSSLVEGSPSPLYPLDSILYSLLFIAIGVFTLIYLNKLQEKLPYVAPSRGPIVTKARGLYCTFVTFWMLIALFTFAAFFLGLFIIDFQHGYQFYSVMLLIAYALSFLFMLVWEFYFNELKEEKKKEFLLPLSIVGLGLSVIVMILYFVSLGLNLDGPANIGFGILPVAFAASVNMATMIVVATPFIVSLVAFIKGLIARKKA